MQPLFKDIRVIGPKDSRKGSIDCTSHGIKDLSPFILGPVHYNGLIAKNVENYWQYSKVYEEYDNNGIPSDGWYKWREYGFSKYWADRYPLGRRKPLYSWNGRRLSYIEARKEIYVPIYTNLVIKTKAYKNLLTIPKLRIWDFDGYSDYENLTQVLNDPTRSMGHGFVLAMLLNRDKSLEECGLNKNMGYCKITS